MGTKQVSLKRMGGAMFEMRLEGGYRMFWSTITPTVCGRLQTMATPDFCRAADFPKYCGQGTRGLWDLWPIDNPARPHPLDEVDRLCRRVKITAQVSRVALISLQHEDDHSPQWLWIELFLSRTDLGQNGQSTFEEWAEILRTAKDDMNKKATLRMDLGIVTAEEIAGFKSQKKLATTNITLEVRTLPVGHAYDP